MEIRRPASTDVRLLGGFAALVVFACHVTPYAGTIVDDAFIIFRYARNLTHGLGLVFNPGERVEGTTSLLWTFWIVAGLRAGLDPIRFAAVSGVSLGALTLVYLSWRFHWLVALVLACSGPFAYWCVAGLETPLFTAILCVALGELYRVGTDAALRRALLVSAAAFGLLHWIRPDGMYFIPMVALPVLALRRHHLARSDFMLAAAFASLPYAALLAWRYAYFGEVQANTYYAKLAMPWHDGFRNQLLQQGLSYVMGFWKTYPVLAALAVAALVLALRRRDKILLIFHVGWALQALGRTQEAEQWFARAKAKP